MDTMRPRKGLKFEIEWSGPGDYERGQVDKVDKDYVYTSYPGLYGHKLRFKRSTWKQMLEREEVFPIDGQYVEY